MLTLQKNYHIMQLGNVNPNIKKLFFAHPENPDFVMDFPPTNKHFTMYFNIQQTFWWKKLKTEVLSIFYEEHKSTIHRVWYDYRPPQNLSIPTYWAKTSKVVVSDPDLASDFIEPLQVGQILEVHGFFKLIFYDIPPHHHILLCLYRLTLFGPILG